MWKDCQHKTISSHSQPHGDRRLWQCSVCKRLDTWGPSWSYYGNYECPDCCRAQIDWVACSDVCRDAFDGSGRRKRAASRARGKEQP